MIFCIGYLVVVNLIAFVMYGVDKRRAVRGMWRIPERVLIGIAILGGSLGAYAGMKHFHHKTQKAKFAVGVPLIIVLQIALVVCIVLEAKKVGVTIF